MKNTPATEEHLGTTPSASPSRWGPVIPGLTLMVVAPLVAEVLPGATRFSALFVFPIEMCVWGGGALLIRGAVRRWGLGWSNMLLLAVALAVAEECLIQQTSLAPMVLELKGEVYGRALGVNYVYLLWALVYEAVFVVFVPVYLVELIFQERREGVWVNRVGLGVVALLFLLGCRLAWFTWTQIARPKVFHLPVYDPPSTAILIVVAIIGVLFFAALGPYRNTLARQSAPLSPPRPWLLGALGFLWAALWYGLVLLGFGIAPRFPPGVAVGAGVLLVAGIVLVLPRWTASPRWRLDHGSSLITGTILGSMLIGFIGFVGAARADLFFKIIIDALAVAFLIALGFKTQRRQTLKNDNPASG